MIYRVTNSEIRYYTPEKRIIQAGYCELQYLLGYTEKKAYNKGIYGWNYDLYELPDGFILTTGYRNMIGKRYTDIYKKYETEAHRIAVTETSIETAKAKLEILKKGMIRDIKIYEGLV